MTGQTDLVSPRNFKIGVVLMLTAYLMFAMADTVNKWLALASLPLVQFAATRYGSHFIITLVEARYRGVKKSDITGHIGLLILRGLLLASSTFAVYAALRHLSLSMFSALLFASPFFVCILSAPLLKEHVGVWRWSAVIVGFVGVLIIIRPFDSAFHISSFAVLYAAFALALYAIATRKLAHQCPPHVMQLFAGGVGTILFVPFAIYLWQPVGIMTMALMIFVGLVSWGGHEMLSRAHKMAPASTLSLYSYSFIIFLTAAGYLIFDEIPDTTTIFGTVIIVMCGLVIWYREAIVKAGKLS